MLTEKGEYGIFLCMERREFMGLILSLSAGLGNLDAKSKKDNSESINSNKRITLEYGITGKELPAVIGYAAKTAGIKENQIVYVQDIEKFQRAFPQYPGLFGKNSSKGLETASLVLGHSFPIYLNGTGTFAGELQRYSTDKTKVHLLRGYITLLIARIIHEKTHIEGSISEAECRQREWEYLQKNLDSLPAEFESQLKDLEIKLKEAKELELKHGQMIAHKMRMENLK